MYQALFPSHGRLLQAISVVYLDIIIFCMEAKAAFRKLNNSKAGKICLTILRGLDDINILLVSLWKFTWKSFNHEFEENTLTRFRNNVKNMEKEVMISHMIETLHDRELLRTEREEAEW